MKVKKLNWARLGMLALFQDSLNMLCYIVSAGHLYLIWEQLCGSKF